jgi:hypothetical protein
MSVEEFKMKLFNLINWVLVLVKDLTSVKNLLQKKKEAPYL